ncbi:MAG: N-acetyltransferase [Lachnospiraceae bacterium]|nr:N-acetyltransferase [Lachnospiraceae bacterium]
MSELVTIRHATLADAKRILEIYTPYILNTAITFEYKVPALEEFTVRMQNTLARYPYLVALINEQIVGYAYASSFKSRAAYDWSVETSIYVDKQYKGIGIGTKLYLALESLLKKQNICNLCACIAYPNPESISFHESFGYTTCAHFHKSGYKQNTWYDMIWMEKTLCEHTEHPPEFIPFPKLTDISIKQ